MRVVDTSIMIERLIGSTMIDTIQPLLPPHAEWLVPTVVQFELAKWLLRTANAEPLRLAEAMTSAYRVVPLTSAVAFAAAQAWDEHKLATADAVIYATARQFGAELLTCDRHFEGLPQVIYLPKPPN
tara:strand:- start:129 stop:509 length:381 start_codon:yes stop_codon:yes gene_type:complete